MVKTKIVCTLGPASAKAAVLRKMIRNGMDVARLNFSHGKKEELLDRIKTVRSLNKSMGRHIRFLGDLQGHRIRVGRLSSPMELKKNTSVRLVRNKRSLSRQDIPFDYMGPLRYIKKGQSIFIDDGNIALEVTGVSKDSLKAKVIVGGTLKPNKGINMPGAKLEFGAMSQKDREDIRFCKENGIDFIAQSFVRTPGDIIEVRKVLGDGSGCKVFAKIESIEGIKNIDAIIRVSDGIMVARGDMGVSLPVYQVPVMQKMIIRKCRTAGKPVITATQMLESMTEHRLPTRAEVSDVANAVLDGTTMVMLSGETAVGKYPAETVKMMNCILEYTEEFGRL